MDGDVKVKVLLAVASIKVMEAVKAAAVVKHNSELRCHEFPYLSTTLYLRLVYLAVNLIILKLVSIIRLLIFINITGHRSQITKPHQSTSDVRPATRQNNSC